MRILFKSVLLINLLVLYTPISQAELTIEITKGVEAAIPIAIVPFGGQAAGAKNLASIVKADLQRSGLFKPLADGDLLARPTEASQVNYKNWQTLGQEYLLVGNVTRQGGQYQVQFQLFDVYKNAQLLGFRLNVAANELRRTAHHISDLVYEKLTGKKGDFSTRLAYITSSGKINSKKYKLIVSDADGYNPRTITSSLEPLMSPAWSADGKKIAYVSFENKRSAIYVQTLATGKRIKASSHKGINGAPAFSPDGTRLAITLSKDGSADIYILNLNNRSLKKLTKSYGIETEASWSPDGRTLVYTSNRGGKPQLYSISSAGGASTRLTFDGDYNSRGQFSSDGKSITMVHANRGDYRIAVMDVATRTINVLTAGRFDESPSFSPNGDMVLYASKKGRRSVLSAVSVDGRTRQNLAFNRGDVREPAWSR